MTVRVEGVLRTPINTPAANIPIKIITTIGAGETLSSAEVTYVTDALGNYGFDLVYATHEIYAMFDDAFELIGTSVANESVPTPTNINDLLHFSTPIQPEIVDKIYDDIYGCIDDLENDINTCMTCMGEQVVQGDTGVCQSMVVYTNDCLEACSAELTTAIQAGDAQTLSQSQAYTDAAGTEIACCTELLSSSMSQLCTTMVASTGANGCSIAALCTDMEAGDASVIQSSKAYTDACTGAVESSISNMVRACDAVVHTCMSAISDADGLHQAGYGIVTSAGDATASITLLATAMTESGVANSEIMMQADKIVMHNGDATAPTYPFYVEGNSVYINCALVNCLEGTEICSANMKAGTMTAAIVQSQGFNSVNNPAGGPPVGYCLGAGGNAEFNDVRVRGVIESSVVCGTTICGGIIKGSAIQSSYIATDVPQLTLTWANQEQYGSMDLTVICGQGNTPYLGWQYGVAASCSTTTPNIKIASYDYTNKGEYNRYTRRYITPYAQGGSQILHTSGTRRCYNVSSPTDYPPDQPFTDVGVSVCFCFRGTGTDRRMDSGTLYDGQSVTKVSGNTCVNIRVSGYCTVCNHSYQTCSGPNRYETTSCTESGYFAYITVYKHDYCANVACFCTNLYTNGSARSHLLCDAADNSTIPSSGGPA